MIPPNIANVEWKQTEPNLYKGDLLAEADDEFDVELQWTPHDPRTIYWASFTLKASGKRMYHASGCDDIDDIHNVLEINVT